MIFWLKIRRSEGIVSHSVLSMFTFHNSRCGNFTQVAEIVSKNALKTYLGVTALATPVGQVGDEFSIVIESNPLVEFVEIPAEWAKICYSQVICGAIRGACKFWLYHLLQNAL